MWESWSCEIHFSSDKDTMWYIGDEHSTINSPTKVSLKVAKVDTTNNHDLCFEYGKGRSVISMEKSVSQMPR